MTITLTARNFTGNSIPLDVDPASKVSDVKDMIARKTGRDFKTALAYKGHEIRDQRSLSHYGISNKDVLHILPPSKAPKTHLQFEKPDGLHFTLQVNSDVTVAQLKRDIAIEEKVDIQMLRYVSSLDEPEDPEMLIVSEPQDLVPDDTLISHFPLSNSTIFICGPPPPFTPQPTFNVQLMLDDHRKLNVEAKLHQTLNDFRETVMLQHNVSIADKVLILVGKEVVGDELPIWDLGFTPDCTIHAVGFISFNVEIIWNKAFDPICLHPLTRLSTVRKGLERDVPDDVALDQYWFTIDGKERLKDWRRLWDLDLVSGCTLYMRNSVISVTIQMSGSSIQLDVEEDETVWGLKERWALLRGISVIPRRITYRNKELRDQKTLKEEGLVGGETLVCLPNSPECEEYQYHEWDT